MREQGKFLESKEIFGSSYGCSREEIERIWQRDKYPVLVIDVEGALEIKKSKFVTTMIFLRPPSLRELKRRLLQRGEDSKEEIEERLQRVEREVSVAHHYDYQLVNDQLEESYRALFEIFKREIKGSV